MYEDGDGKIAKLFPTYLVNPANHETFVIYGIILFASFCTQTTLLLSYELKKEEIVSQVMYKCVYTFLIRVMSIFRKSQSSHATIKLTTLDVQISL